MEKTKQEVEKLLGRKMDTMEEVIFDISKNDDNYEFRRGKNGYLEAHSIKKSPVRVPA